MDNSEWGSIDFQSLNNFYERMDLDFGSSKLAKKIISELVWFKSSDTSKYDDKEYIQEVFDFLDQFINVEFEDNIILNFKPESNKNKDK